MRSFNKKYHQLTIFMDIPHNKVYSGMANIPVSDVYIYIYIYIYVHRYGRVAIFRSQLYIFVYIYVFSYSGSPILSFGITPLSIQSVPLLWVTAPDQTGKCPYRKMYRGIYIYIYIYTGFRRRNTIFWYVGDSIPTMSFLMGHKSTHLCIYVYVCIYIYIYIY